MMEWITVDAVAAVTENFEATVFKAEGGYRWQVWGRDEHYRQVVKAAGTEATLEEAKAAAEAAMR